MAIERMGRSNGGQGGRIVNVASVAGFTVILKILKVPNYVTDNRKVIFSSA